MFRVGLTANVMDANKLLDVSETCQCKTTSSDKIVFLGAHSVFSNFHSCQFTANNITYNCAEQLIQCKKTALFDDDITQVKILHEKNPFCIKRLGSKVCNFNIETWKKSAKQIVYTAVSATFQQCPVLRDI